MTKITNLYTAISPRNLFLFDASGATLTAITMFFILPYFNTYLNIPVWHFTLYGIIAALLFTVSSSAYILQPRIWRRLMKAVAYGNLAYCVIVAVNLMLYSSEMTSLGTAYFIIEIILISALAIFEWNYAMKSDKPMIGRSDE